MKKYSHLILAWLLLAATSFAITRQIYQSKVVEISSRQNSPSAPRLRSLEGKLKFFWKTSGSAASRLQELDRYLETANTHHLARLYYQLRRMDDSLVTRVAMGMILEQWILTAPDSAWAAMMRREITTSAFVEQYLHSASPDDLWQRITKEGKSFRASELKLKFCTEWLQIFPDKVDELQHVTEMSDTEIHQYHFEDARNREDLSTLLQLAEVKNSAVTTFSLALAAQHTYRDVPLDGLTALDKIPERFKREFLVETFDWWPSDKEPGPAIDFALALEDSDLKINLLTQRFGDDNYSPYTAEVVERALSSKHPLTDRELEKLVDHMEYADAEEIRELLPRLQGRAYDIALASTANNTYGRDLPEALEFGNQLESKYHQRLYFKKLMDNDFRQNIAIIEPWINQITPEDLHHFGVSRQLVRQAAFDSERAFALAEKLLPEDRKKVWNDALESHLYHSPAKAGKLLEAHPEIVTPEAIEIVFDKWHENDPEAAREWRRKFTK